MGFCTILHSIKSPKNVGMIIRSHVAYNGDYLIMTGLEHPWQFKKGTKTFSRHLEDKCNILHIPGPENALAWCKQNKYTTVAVEILDPPKYINTFKFPEKTAFIFGNESDGLENDFLKKCDQVITIPQSGQVGSLNVAVSASISMYEYSKSQVLFRPEIDRHRFHN